MPKVFVFGVDGGSYWLIKKFVEEGIMPNFKKLIENGVMGKFKSTTPPHTAPGWASIFTGVNPGMHGIYQFWKTQSENYIGDFQGSHDLNSIPLWKMLNENSIKTGMINIPMTHPPLPIDGFMVSWPLSNTINYSYPKTMLNEIAKAGGYFYPDLFNMFRGQDDYINQAYKITRKRVKTIEYLVKEKEWDFLMTVFTEVDRISHYYWHYMDKLSPYYIEDEEKKNAIRGIYSEVDKAAGDIISFLPEDTLFVSLSDHGFRCGKINFNIHSFLIEKGYMFLKKCDDDYAESSSNNDNIYENWFNLKYNNENYEVDWEKTKVFMASPCSYGINVNLVGRQKQGIIDKNIFLKIFKELRAELLKIKYPDEDKPLFKDVLLGKDVYRGNQQYEGPDIILIPEDYGVMVSHKIIPGELFSEPDQKGMHCRDGYILFNGPEVDRGKKLYTSDVTDFVPTILDYYRMRVPDFIEGNSIDVFKNKRNRQVSLSENDLDYRYEKEKSPSYSAEEKKDIEERLKNLGYL